MFLVESDGKKVIGKREIFVKKNNIKMPNLINRRKKKNKILDIVINEKSDSDSSTYGFSSKLNNKYNVIPDESNDVSRKVAAEECLRLVS